MALVNLNFESKYLQCNHDVTIILPDKPRCCDPKVFYIPEKKYKTLYLLHGTFGDHTDWYRHTNIELYACERDLIVVMPSAINTNYQNWPDFGTGYFLYDYIIQELMPMVQCWFPSSDKKEDNFIGGLSMGARGAMMIALQNEDKFAGVAALSAFPRDLENDRPYLEEAMNTTFLEDSIHFSGPFDPDFRMRRFQNEIRNNGGNVNAYIKKCNPMIQLRKYAQGKQSLKLYCACGKADALYPEYTAFKKICTDLEIEATFVEEEGFKHEWRFWDKYIEKALEFFGMTGEIGGKEFLG